MTNEQLLILIRSWRVRLENELTFIESNLPDNVERLQTREYRGPAFFPVLDKDERNWQTVPGPVISLLGLQDFIDELKQAERDLMPSQVSDYTIARFAEG